MAKNKASVDIGVIIALKEEFQDFAVGVGVQLTSQPTTDGDVYYHFHFPDVNGASRTGIVTFIGEMGETDAGPAAERLLAAYPVTLLIVVGIAGIVSDDIKIGQVVVASGADSYAHRGKETPSGFAVGGDPWKTSQLPLKLVDNLETAYPAIFEKWRQLMAKGRNDYLSERTVELLRSMNLLPLSAAIATGPIVTVPSVGGSRGYKAEVRIRNRNYLVMEMETAAILAVAEKRKRPPARLVVRGVSDPGDERKKEFDGYDDGGIRKWAIGNAYGLLRLLLRELPLFALIEEEGVALPKALPDAVTRVLHVSDQHLRPEYAALDPETLLRRANAIVSCAETPISIDSIIDAVTTQAGYAIRVDGEWGVGKSTVLEAIYHRMITAFRETGAGVLPAYLDVRHYDRLEATSEAWPLVARKELETDLQPLLDLIKFFPDQKIALLVDGVEEDVSERDELEKELVFWQRKLSTVRRIVGVARRRGTGEIPAHITSMKEVVKLAPVSVHSPSADVLLDAFAQLNAVSPADLRKQLEALEIDDLDVTTMMIGLASLSYSGWKSAADVYKAWCENYLAGAERRTSPFDLGKLAYRIDFETDQALWSDLRQSKAWSLVRIHDTVRAFLVASYVVEHLASSKIKWSKAKSVLSRVYTFNVNRFCKDLLNSSQSRQRDALKQIEKRYAGGPVELQITLAYCAGRLSDRVLREQARVFLRGSLAELVGSIADAKPSRDQLMLLRTLFISLIRLEDTNASSEYIEWMLRNRELDEINRGFHLEYYHDIPYSPNYPRGHYDLPTHPIRKTVSRLIDRVERAIAGKYSAVEVEIYTLASLAQFRLANAALAEDLQNAIRDVLERALPLVSTPALQRYLQMLLKHLRAPAWSITHGFHELYRIKIEPRRGWAERHLTNFEMVATHMYGAYLLAVCMLPDSSDGAYDKRKILDMLLIHDLSEALTRDRLPDEKNDQTREEDDRASGYISMLSTYTESSDLLRVYELWREFEEGDSLNARIARDIDKLENWFQLHVYDRNGMRVPDTKEFAADLVSKVSTNEGRNILAKFRLFFAGLGPRPNEVASIA